MVLINQNIVNSSHFLSFLGLEYIYFVHFLIFASNIINPDDQKITSSLLKLRSNHRRNYFDFFMVSGEARFVNIYQTDVACHPKST